MSKLTITFTESIVDIQVAGGDPKQVRSTVHADIVTDDGKTFPDVVFEVVHPLGDSFAIGSLRVSKPVGYDGPCEVSAFHDAVEDYYRKSLARIAARRGPRFRR